MDPQQLQIILGQLAQVLGLPPPPPLAPDQVASTRSIISQLLAALGMAGNVGDPVDLAEAEAGQAERELQTGAALAKFPVNEEQAAQAMQQVMGLAQQMPQSLSQGIGGVFGGFVQQFNQALQQGVQAGQQLVSGLGNAGQGAELAGELPAEALGDSLGAGGALLGAGGGAGAGLASTMPAGNLGPPATPSAATFPSSAAVPAPPPGAPEPPGAARGGVGGYPMMPPGTASGSGTGGDAKADTKRVVPPAVKNGAAVQGRVSTPPQLPEVTKHVQGKPVATRRIVGPGQRSERDGDVIN